MRHCNISDCQTPAIGARAHDKSIRDTIDVPDISALFAITGALGAFAIRVRNMERSSKIVSRSKRGLQFSSTPFIRKEDFNP
jgi:hypothetical protein